MSTFCPVPDFEAKLLDTVGSYLNPPENLQPLCVDEKPSFQALDRDARKTVDFLCLRNNVVKSYPVR
jgi:hypothetical protein